MTEIPLDGLEAGREALRRFLTGEGDLDAMLSAITTLATMTLATMTVPGCDSASITMLRRGEPVTPVFTDAEAAKLDERQYADGDGPCLAAIRHRGVEHVSISSDARWPAFRAAAQACGVRATMSVPLVDEDSVLGGLNLYSSLCDAFEPEAREVAGAFADQLGVAAANAARYAEGYELVQQLQRAMESRAVIEQAKGILMRAQRCGPDEAFDILRRASQSQNRKLRAVATDIVERYTQP